MRVKATFSQRQYLPLNGYCYSNCFCPAAASLLSLLLREMPFLPCAAAVWQGEAMAQRMAVLVAMWGV
jgi:hypothetical protein